MLRTCGVIFGWNIMLRWQLLLPAVPPPAGVWASHLLSLLCVAHPQTKASLALTHPSINWSWRFPRVHCWWTPLIEAITWWHLCLRYYSRRRRRRWWWRWGWGCSTLGLPMHLMALGRPIAESWIKIRLEHVHKQLLQLLKAFLPLQIQKSTVIMLPFSLTHTFFLFW